MLLVTGQGAPPLLAGHSEGLAAVRAAAQWAELVCLGAVDYEGVGHIQASRSLALHPARSRCLAATHSWEAGELGEPAHSGSTVQTHSATLPDVWRQRAPCGPCLPIRAGVDWR